MKYFESSLNIDFEIDPRSNCSKQMSQRRMEYDNKDVPLANGQFHGNGLFTRTSVNMVFNSIDYKKCPIDLLINQLMRLCQFEKIILNDFS